MSIYRYEFNADDFTKGYCPECPLAYAVTDMYGDYAERCVIGRRYDECPLEEVEEDG